ncbi:MAG: polyphenol oxidase family protein [Candidatus Omnitrophica bacterium]|nr:polyphenol oxidase family protein [Candidatus Omnitrophota bacterium]
MVGEFVIKNKFSTFGNFNFSNLVIAFSRRSDGNMSLNCGDTANSLSNRYKFLKALGIDYQSLVCAKQTHSANITYVKAEDRGKGALDYASAIDNTDAFITKEKNLPLAVFTADCLSIFLYDPKALAIGLVHAGFKGTLQDISGKTVKLMQKRLNTDPKNLYAIFGPAIRICCYRPDETCPDLIELNKRQLLSCGIKEENIFDSGFCTYCQNAEFFSFRKEGRASGRMISVIMLK